MFTPLKQTEWQERNPQFEFLCCMLTRGGWTSDVWPWSPGHPSTSARLRTWTPSSRQTPSELQPPPGNTLESCSHTAPVLGQHGEPSDTHTHAHIHVKTPFKSIKSDQLTARFVSDKYRDCEFVCMCLFCRGCHHVTDIMSMGSLESQPGTRSTFLDQASNDREGPRHPADRHTLRLRVNITHIHTLQKAPSHWDSNQNEIKEVH